MPRLGVFYETNTVTFATQAVREQARYADILPPASLFFETMHDARLSSPTGNPLWLAGADALNHPPDVYHRRALDLHTRR